MGEERCDCGELRERLARLDEALLWHRELADREAYGMDIRLNKLEQARAQDQTLGLSAIVKILLAICLPILAFLLTGDLKLAMMAAKAGGSGL